MAKVDQWPLLSDELRELLPALLSRARARKPPGAVEDIGKADLLDTFDTAWASGLQDLPRDRMDGSEIDGFTAPKR